MKMDNVLFPVYCTSGAMAAAFLFFYAQLHPTTLMAFFLTFAATAIVGFFAAVILMLPVLAKMCGKAAEL